MTPTGSLGEESSPKPETVRRRILLIKRALQTKYVGLVFFTVLLTVFLVSLDLYYILGKNYINQLGGENFLQIVKGTLRLLSVHLPVYFFLVILVSVFISHKFAGPIFRLEKVAEAIAKGDLTVKAALRAGDELFETAESMNQMIELLRQKLLKEKHLSDRISKTLSEISDKLAKGALTTESAALQLKDVLIEVQHIASDFKL